MIVSNSEFLSEINRLKEKTKTLIKKYENEPTEQIFYQIILNDLNKIESEFKLNKITPAYRRFTTCENQIYQKCGLSNTYFSSILDLVDYYMNY